MSSKLNSKLNAGVANASNTNPLPPAPVLYNKENETHAPDVTLSPMDLPITNPEYYDSSPMDLPITIPEFYDSWTEPATSTSYTESSSSIANVNFIPIIAIVMVVVVAISIVVRCFQHKRPAFRNNASKQTNRQVPYGHHDHVPMATAVYVGDGGAASAGACSTAVYVGDGGAASAGACSSAMGGGGDCGGGGF